MINFQGPWALRALGLLQNLLLSLYFGGNVSLKPSQNKKIRKLISVLYRNASTSRTVCWFVSDDLHKYEQYTKIRTEFLMLLKLIITHCILKWKETGFISASCKTCFIYLLSSSQFRLLKVKGFFCIGRENWHAKLFSFCPFLKKVINHH